MKRIAELRKEKHLNQTGLGLKLNVSQKMVSAYESGLHQPGINTLKEMSAIFGVSVDYIIENSNIKSPAESLSGDSLSPDELELIALYRALSSKHKQRAIGIVFALSKTDT